MVETKKFKVESSPHIFSSNYKYKIMWLVVLALLPAAFLGVVNFGMRALLVIIVAVSTAILTEALFEKLRNKSNHIEQGPAIVTGLLLGLVLPPTVPLWLPVLGSFVAIAIAKHAFGGAGMTIFNPALVGRGFLVASFPAFMTSFIWPDGVTSASPLAMLKLQGYSSAIGFFGGKLAAYKSMFFGNISGCIGETSALALLIGGLFLIYMKVIDWKIPTIYIGTVFVLTAIFGQDPFYHILGGGLFIGAFFMATAYEGMPITYSGRIYFALGLGVLTTVIRLWGGYPEGVNYSILLMNAAAPLIERLTIKKPFGYVKKKK
jgi:H+/Na+-translocating ferredoxin:NAD+ oxidoreductase subunit D